MCNTGIIPVFPLLINKESQVSAIPASASPHPPRLSNPKTYMNNRHLICTSVQTPETAATVSVLPVALVQACTGLARSVPAAIAGGLDRLHSENSLWVWRFYLYNVQTPENAATVRVLPAALLQACTNIRGLYSLPSPAARTGFRKTSGKLSDIVCIRPDPACFDVLYRCTRFFARCAGKKSWWGAPCEFRTGSAITRH